VVIFSFNCCYAAKFYIYSCLRPSWSYKHSTDRDTCVFKFNSSLLFANCERFTEALNKTLNRWLAFRLQESSILPQTDDSNDKATSRPLFVFDCTAIIQLDSMGLQTLLQSIKIIEEEHNVCIQFFNVNCESFSCIYCYT
jgi:MFS superfamily sulfate permease-like transporter